jgi:hypothetical protein
LKVFRLYGTSACHLCELAADMIMAQAATLQGVDVEAVDISESEILFERYGLRIPVLQHPDNRELNWPFSPLQLQAFLAT